MRLTARLGDRGRLVHLRDKFIEVVVKIRQSGIDLFRPQIRMLTQQFFRRPTVMKCSAAR